MNSILQDKLIVIAEIYSKRQKINPGLLGIYSYLLGQEYTSPLITTMNIDTNNMLWIGFHPTAYPNVVMANKEDLIKLIEKEAADLDFSLSTYAYLTEKLNAVPNRFEIPDKVFRTCP